MSQEEDAVVPEVPPPADDDGEKNNSDSDDDDEESGSQEQDTNGTPNGTNDENFQPNSASSGQEENLLSGAIPIVGIILEEVGDDGEPFGGSQIFGGSQQVDSDVDQFISNSQCSVSSSLSMYQPSLPSRSPHPLRDYETSKNFFNLNLALIC